MADESHLDALISVWQQQAEKGDAPTPQELCRECPELLGEVEARIEVLKKMGDFLGQLQSSTNGEEGLDGAPTVAHRADPMSSFRPPESIATAQANKTTPERTDQDVSKKVFAGYRLIELLGKGGMGVVYKAQDKRLPRLVALKMILNSDHASPEDETRFQLEAEAIARVQHPNIVQIFEVGESDGKPFFCLELCEGGSLADKLKDGPMKPEEAAKLTETLARGVQAVHEKGICHRDLKPGNVLFTHDGIPKITDFGLAKQTDQEGATHTGAVMGTPSYMAPEQAAGTKAIGQLADVYALGAILYHLLTGSPPHTGATPWDIIAKVKNTEPVRPKTVRRDIPKDLETICLKAIEKTPGKRYANAAGLADDLNRFLLGEPVLAVRTGIVGRVIKSAKRHPVIFSLVSALVIVLAAGLVGVTWEYRIAKANEGKAIAERERAEQTAKHLREEQEKVVAALEKVKNERTRANSNAAKAARQAEKATKVAAFLQGLFDSADPIGLSISSVNPERGTKLSARTILDRGFQRIERELRDEPAVRSALLTIIGGVYRNLGQLKQAEKLLLEAVRLRRTKNSEATKLQLGATLFELAWLYHTKGDYERAESLYRESLSLASKNADGAALATRCKFHLAAVYAEDMRNQKAEALFREVLGERIEQYGEQHKLVTVAKIGLAAVLFQEGETDEAIGLALQGVAGLQKQFQKTPVGPAIANLMSALAMQKVGIYSTAEQQMKSAIKLLSEDFRDNNVYVSFVYGLLAENALLAKKPKEADKYMQECVKVFAIMKTKTHPMYVRAVQLRARILAAAGEKKKACEICEKVLDALEKKHGKTHWRAMRAHARYGFLLDRMRVDDKAERHYRKAIEIGGDNEPVRDVMPWVLRNLADILSRTKPDEAQKLYRRSIRWFDPRKDKSAIEGAFRSWLRLAATRNNGAGLREALSVAESWQRQHGVPQSSFAKLLARYRKRNSQSIF